ncbi:hypothetical protein F3Y22_tig00116961pilonHSYRG00164 [Hibiscus syriacus]|uniref:CCHC-type domain-containing protein n=1 Tax=Hibiscus syriacus TaxID=106335 RepID=A0A6A2XUE7_HIBSY|nr:hypothetical protein F3Y22_tig00116961pilonHSYRG00164 [Hibiscus syriacus]
MVPPTSRLSFDLYSFSSVQFLLYTMADNVGHLLANLQFTEDETSDVLLPGSSVRSIDAIMKFWVVGYLFTTAPVDGDSLIWVFRSIWGMTRVTDISTSGPHHFLIRFTSAATKAILIDRTLWLFNGDLLAITSYRPDSCLDDYDFSSLAIWIRVYDVPLGWMTQYLSNLIARRLDTPLAIDLRPGAGRMGSYLRIRVAIDVRKPLRPCLAVGRRSNGRPSLYMLWYERLHSFCGRCGVIGHLIVSCPS